MDVSIQDREVVMPAPSTVVTLVDEDGDEFPIRLDGVTVNVGIDFDEALWTLQNEMPEMKPRGRVTLGKIEYFNAPAPEPVFGTETLPSRS